MQLLGIPILLLLPVAAFAAEPVDFKKDIRPILQERCFACHGALAQKSKLRVDSAANLLKAWAVVPGKSADSELIARVSSADDATRMPPEGHPLKPVEIAKLKEWIDRGAKPSADDAPEPDPRDHWSFRTPLRPVVPKGSTNTIDAFAAAEWTKRGLKPVAPADKRVLLRRVYIDLIGLPPTPEQTEAFSKDAAPNAYEKVVDGLLASPQYGERWGRHFLDIWRYSDWWGLGAELRNSQRHIWRWRDWVVESFNADLGYDEMIRQMLAADELYPTDPSKLRATGYLARPYFLHNRTTWLDEVVEHAGKGFLGLTFNCAKCHDHKYDPIKQSDYYGFRAFFEPYQLRTDLVPGEPDASKDGLSRAFDSNPDAKTPFHIRGDERNPDKDRVVRPGLPQFLVPEGLKIAPVKLPLLSHRPGSRPEIAADHRKVAEAKPAAAREALAKAKTDPAVAKASVLKPELVEANLRAAAGSVASAEADLNSVATRIAADASGTKEDARKAAKAEKQHAHLAAMLAVARAEVDMLKAGSAVRPAAEQKKKAAEAALTAAKKAAENPGETYTPIPGAVKTVESNAEPAESKARPLPDSSTGRRTALANWIADAKNPMTARVAVNHVWLRHFGRPLVPNMFEFGRKGSPPSHPELLDWLAVELMENKWSFKHLHKTMVTSDVYRLSSSSANAESSAKLDGENRYLWRMNPTRMEAQVVRDSLLHLAGDLDHARGGPPVPVASQDASRRRSLYFFHSHTEQSKLLGVFDDASVLECYRRTESIVPQQALALWNSRLAMLVASKINERLGTKLGDAEFVAAAFATVLGAPPTREESAACLETLAEVRAALTDGNDLEKTNRARLQVVQALINHNDFVTVR